MGTGWAYTALALIFLAGSPAMWVIMRYSLKWRGQRKSKKGKQRGKRGTSLMRRGLAKDKLEQHWVY